MNLPNIKVINKSNLLCPICSSNQVKICGSGIRENVERTIKKYDYLRCLTCQVVSLQPSPSQTDLQEHYCFLDQRISDVSSNEKGLNQKNLLNQKVANKGIAGYFQRVWRDLNPEYSTLELINQGKVLDLGSGSGRFCQLLDEKGIEVYGLEQSSNAVAFANANDLHIKQGNILSANTYFKDQCFDYITLNHVIEHLLDPIFFLNSIKPLLSPNGKLILTLPNVNSVWRLIFGFSWHGWDPPIHVHHYDRKAIIYLLNQSGYLTVSVSTKNRPDGFTRSLNKLLGKQYRFLLLRIFLFPFALLMEPFNMGDELVVIAEIQPQALNGLIH